MLELGFQFSNHGSVGLNFFLIAAAFLQLLHVAIEADNDVLIVLDLVFLRAQVFLAEEFIEDHFFIMHRRDRDASAIP